jgi:hypothetical protein
VDGWMDGGQPSRVFSPLWLDDHVGLLKTPSDSRCQMWCGKSRRIRLYENTDWMVGLFLLALNGPFSSFRNDSFHWIVG